MKVLNKEKLLKLVAEKEGIDEGTRYTLRKCTENTKSFRFGAGSEEEEKRVYIVMGTNEYFLTYDYYKEMMQNCLTTVEDTEENRTKYKELEYVFETEVKQAKEKKKKK